MPPRASWTSGPRSVVVLIGFLLASYLVAGVAGVSARAGVAAWYNAAPKPFFTPPNWLFPPIWTLMYGLIALAAWQLWQHRDTHPLEVSRGLWQWWTQLMFNLAWTPIFFAMKWLWPALTLIVILDVMVWVTLCSAAKVSRAATWLLVPYFAWLLYATALNLGVALLSV
ncbi:tryptophan-rich sensory protein [Crossiella sp. CA-258035]|uniref:TspO/MBR family protein n=1 Tax=Crossiella sp. CA-258035 TaxID=2981138 RepID=UPI0024BD15D3|nr:TspO/MBR family protein [Crossiella sp. CA-258035]WHT18220.1 tryptophan-rich sensory protein [Crossiella sp. CA-258035]